MIRYSPLPKKRLWQLLLKEAERNRFFQFSCYPQSSREEIAKFPPKSGIAATCVWT